MVMLGLSSTLFSLMIGNVLDCFACCTSLARQSGSNTELIIRANNRRGSGKTGTLNFDLVMRALEGLVLAFLVIRIGSV
jgi:hypothetical protein